MPVREVTKFLSETSSFFRENDSVHAMLIILAAVKAMRMNERRLFGRKGGCDSKYSLPHMPQSLLVCPCVLIRNSFNIYGFRPVGSPGCRKDLFHKSLDDERAGWRKLMCHIVCRICTNIVFTCMYVRIFFMLCGKRELWSALAATELDSESFEAYGICSGCWPREVIFKESEGLSGLGKCQAVGFALQRV